MGDTAPSARTPDGPSVFRRPLGPALPPQARALLPRIVPALVVGVGCALTLLAISWVAGKLEHAVWTWLPDRLGLAFDSPGWTIAVLGVTGMLVGLLVRSYPGMAAIDPATLGMVDPPQPVRLLPGITVAAVLALAGGVSLGPENPITAINLALAFQLGRRAVPGLAPAEWLGLAAAGTIGALFGTPVAAALVLSELAVGEDARPLWDRLFAPLFAAGAGALTTVLVSTPEFAVSVPPYRGFHIGDTVSGMVVAGCAALLGLVAVACFPYVHALFHRLRDPAVMVTVGGVVLGLLGWAGGRITLFKGVEQVKQLSAQVAQHSTANLVLVTLIKLLALVVAASAGFWGGRIFPAVFVGVAFGLLAHRLVPEVPSALAVTAGVLGVLLATTRQGWLSLFVAAVLTHDIRLLPVLCVSALPAWLLVTGRPDLTLRKAP